MTDMSAQLTRAGNPSTAGFVSSTAWGRPDRRRVLQLVLATVWLLDGVLQLQATFFSSSFGKSMIGSMAGGNPSIIARPISWSSDLIRQNPTATNAVFAAIQILIGLAIAWRPSVKIGLAASIVWSLGVWWVGEGLGGVLSGAANTVNGAPGAVIIYALLAVLLWPRETPVADAPFVAAQAVGAKWANGLWVVLWGSLSFFAVAGTNRAAGTLHDLISGEASGEPGWVQWLDKAAASAVGSNGLTFTILLALLSAVVAIGVFLPPRGADATLALAMVLGAMIWVFGENFGALFTNGATDLNSGPLLILLAVAYWRPLGATAVATTGQLATQGA